MNPNLEQLTRKSDQLIASIQANMVAIEQTQTQINQYYQKLIVLEGDRREAVGRGGS